MRVTVNLVRRAVALAHAHRHADRRGDRQEDEDEAKDPLPSHTRGLHGRHWTDADASAPSAGRTSATVSSR